jgi:hypothetical protein
MKREARLQSAKIWIPKYEGKNIVRGYAKWYGVDFLCSIIELRMLGINVDENYEANVRRSIEAKAEQRKQKRRFRKEKKFCDPYADSDDTFAYIAGYTSGGFPYGVTWDEIDEKPPWIDNEDIEHAGGADGL